MDIPKFNRGFLSEVSESLRKRSKAIRHATHGQHLQKVIIRDEQGYDEEKFEVDLAGSATSGQDPEYCFHFWEDRWCLIDGRQYSKAGWVWEHRIEGRILPLVPSRNIVSLIEQTYHLYQIQSHEPGDFDTLSAVDALWEPILAAKPRLVLN